MATKAPLGILAGAGKMPLMAAKTVRAAGRPVVAVQFAETGQKKLGRYCDQCVTLSVGHAGAMLDYFTQHGVKEILLIGKVDKQLNFADIEFDAAALTMLARLPDRQDSSLFGVIADELKSRGMRVAKQTIILADLLVPEGHLAGPTPGDKVARDIALGFEVATAVAGYDIGQAVAVKAGTVIAVEAFEHTDACVRRAGKLAGRGLTVCKVSRPKQDPRFDVPTIGPSTISTLARVGATALAVEAGAVLLLEPEKVYAAADAHAISLVGVSQS
ncbi:MAG: UDP-2,3-diacylglucosamine diphosphatase LpxI [Candidatus Lernaella stagnicola]|nr:UDP-2,3-diacylglucosamine diphosphatase LpxI [Candidatus Lernaella stagnicola]